MQDIIFKKVKKLLLSSFSVCFMSFVLVSLLILIFAKSGIFKNYGNSITAYLISLILFILIFTIALNNSKKAGLPEIIILLAVSAFLVFIRKDMFSFTSRDFNLYLNSWLSKLRGMNFRQFLITPVGDYNITYMYILFIISKIPVKSVFLIKGVSCLFDVASAYFAMRLAGYKNSRYNLKLSAFFAVLALPTAILNSSCWGQCDSIYTAFILAGVYFALKKHPHLSVVMFGLSFAFKFQAIIALPIMIVLIFKKKIKLYHLLEFPAVCVLPILPAVIAGRPAGDILSVYYNQLGSQNSLTYNAATFLSFTNGAPYDIFKGAGIATAIAAILILLYEAYRKRDRLKDKTIMDFLFAFSLFVPYFLPSMHDRYFYLADICAVIYFFYHTKRWYYPAALFICSYNDYAYYLFGSHIVDENITALVRGAVIALVIKDYIKQNILNQESKPEFPEHSLKETMIKAALK